MFSLRLAFVALLACVAAAQGCEGEDAALDGGGSNPSDDDGGSGTGGGGIADAEMPGGDGGHGGSAGGGTSDDRDSGPIQDASSSDDGSIDQADAAAPGFGPPDRDVDEDGDFDVNQDAWNAGLVTARQGACGELMQCDCQEDPDLGECVVDSDYAKTLGFQIATIGHAPIEASCDELLAVCEDDGFGTGVEPIEGETITELPAATGGAIVGGIYMQTAYQLSGECEPVSRGARFFFSPTSDTHGNYARYAVNEEGTNYGIAYVSYSAVGTEFRSYGTLDGDDTVFANPWPAGYSATSSEIVLLLANVSGTCTEVVTLSKE